MQFANIKLLHTYIYFYMHFTQNRTKRNSRKSHQQEYQIIDRYKRIQKSCHKRPYSGSKKNSFQLPHHQCVIDSQQHTNLPRRLK